MFGYRISGLSVTSDVALHGVFALPALSAQPEVTIRRAGVPAELAGATRTGPIWQFAPERFLLAIPSIGRFLVTGGTDIAVAPEAGVPDDDLSVFLAGSVFGVLLHQRGRIVLHASAVDIGGRAVLFCGQSGAGKSTMAAALVEQGHALASDDVAALEFRDGAVLVHPDGRALKLWDDAVRRLGLEGLRGGAIRQKLGKFFVPPAEASPAPLPVGALYLLREARPPYEPGITRPPLAEAAPLLRHNAYRPRFVELLDQRADYFRTAAAVSAAGGIFHLTRPLAYDALPGVVGALRDHWRTILPGLPAR